MKKTTFIPVVLFLMAPGAALAAGENNETNIFVDQSAARTNLIPTTYDKVWEDLFYSDPATIFTPNEFTPPPNFVSPPDLGGEVFEINIVSFPCPPTQASCPFDRTGLTSEETEEFFDTRSFEPIFGDGFEAETPSAFDTVP